MRRALNESSGEDAKESFCLLHRSEVACISDVWSGFTEILHILRTCCTCMQIRARQNGARDSGVTTRRNSCRSPQSPEDCKREGLALLRTRIPINDWLVEIHEVNIIIFMFVKFALSSSGLRSNTNWSRRLFICRFSWLNVILKFLLWRPADFRFLGKLCGVCLFLISYKRRVLQLVCTAAMMLAAKYQEIYPPEVQPTKISDFDWFHHGWCEAIV